MPSTSITFTTDSTLFDLFVQAACASYGYRDTIADPANPGQIIPNPQTPQQFARQKVIDYCVEVVRAYQTEVAAQQARKAASDSLDAQVAVTPIQVTIS
jgi:hypothetical protein